MEFGGGLPAHRDFHTPVRVHIHIINTVNRRAGAFNLARKAVGILLGGEDTDFQGLLVGGIAEKRYRLLPAVAVEVDELDGLNIGTGRRRGVLRAAVENFR